MAITDSTVTAADRKRYLGDMLGPFRVGTARASQLFSQCSTVIRSVGQLLTFPECSCDGNVESLSGGPPGTFVRGVFNVVKIKEADQRQVPGDKDDEAHGVQVGESLCGAWCRRTGEPEVNGPAAVDF